MLFLAKKLNSLYDKEQIYYCRFKVSSKSLVYLQLEFEI